MQQNVLHLRTILSHKTYQIGIFSTLLNLFQCLENKYCVSIFVDFFRPEFCHEIGLKEHAAPPPTDNDEEGPFLARNLRARTDKGASNSQALLLALLLGCAIFVSLYMRSRS